MLLLILGKGEHISPVYSHFTRVIIFMCILNITGDVYCLPCNEKNKTKNERSLTEAKKTNGVHWNHQFQLNRNLPPLPRLVPDEVITPTHHRLE